jgi:small conductance mechanosensitive channel
MGILAKATLEQACGIEPGNVCEWVYDQTNGNESLAQASDWLIGRPLTIVLIILMSLIFRLIARAVIYRGVRRMLMPGEHVKKQLRALGIDAPAGAGDEINKARRTARAISISSVLVSTASVLIWTIAFMAIMRVIGIDLAPLIAGAGIAGVALGFGAQSLVRDCINGVFILLEDQFGIGDTVDLGEATGEVEKVSLRTTVLRGVDGTVWHVPNGEILRVGNRSQLWSRALIDVVVAASTDLTRATEILTSTATTLAQSEEWSVDILEEPRVLGVEAVDADGVTLRLLVKTTPGRQWAVQRALREAIKSDFETNGIKLPPARGTVLFNVDPRTGQPPENG